MSGYKPYTEVLAQRSSRGKHRKTYVLSLPLYLIGTYLPVPDPDTPFPGNRRVNKRHAEKFADYWLQTEDWVTPPLLVDTTVALQDDFDPTFSAGGVEFGILRLQQNSAASFDILDGQHRILGWKLAGDRIAEEMKSLRSKLQHAKETGQTDSLEHWETRLAECKRSLDRYEREYVTVEVLQGLTDEGHRQAFNDIATNALGITKSVTVSFDRRSLINRVAIDAEAGIDLLSGRVDWEKDRIAGRNESLLSGKNLADIVRHVALGINGRMTKRRESEMSEAKVASLVEEFFSVLTRSFPSIAKLASDETNVLDVREHEMTLSPTVLRVLAGTFHNLAVDLSDERFPTLVPAGSVLTGDLFKQLSEHVGFPLDERWYLTGFFADSAKSPLSRSQDLTGLTDLLTHWAKAGCVFVGPDA